MRQKYGDVGRKANKKIVIDKDDGKVTAIDDRVFDEVDGEDDDDIFVKKDDQQKKSPKNAAPKKGD